MAKGNDEAHNPNRRPKRPGEQTEEEKLAIIKQVFPNAQEIDTNNSQIEPGTDVEAEEEQQRYFEGLADKYSIYQNYPEDDYDDYWRDSPDKNVDSKRNPDDGFNDF